MPVSLRTVRENKGSHCATQPALGRSPTKPAAFPGVKAGPRKRPGVRPCSKRRRGERPRCERPRLWAPSSEGPRAHGRDAGLRPARLLARAHQRNMGQQHLIAHGTIGERRADLRAIARSNARNRGRNAFPRPAWLPALMLTSPRPRRDRGSARAAGVLKKA